MDIATIGGIILGFVIVGVAIAMGGAFGVFVDPASMLIVLGGGIATTVLRFRLAEVATALVTGAKIAFGDKSQDARALIEEIRKLADVSRREGPVALEGVEVSDPLLARGKQMITDGFEPAGIRTNLELQRELEIQRLVEGERIFRALGEAAPAFGMIGTLIGLVQMLSSMDDPSSIGPAMAVALLTTLYGALVSNVLALPVADKLAAKLDTQETNLSLMIDGLMQVAERKSPDIITDLLVVYLPEKSRAAMGEAAVAA